MTTDEFVARLKKSCNVGPGDHVLAAVSGGADSAALLCLLHQARDLMGICISCAHVEHGIRGDESVMDMEFVRDLCLQMNIGFYAKHVDAPEYARRNGCGLEAAARTLRYAFLEETRAAIGADVIATAHHSGDQAETVLMHAARGSDLRGLCAMRARSGRIIRPLLYTPAAELRAYLRECGQAWREDATNEDTDYTRNYIRHRVMPELERAYVGAGSALSRLALAAQRDEDYFAQQIDALDIRLISLVGGVAVETAQIRGLHDALLSRVLVYLMDAAGAQASSYTLGILMGALRRGETSAAVSIGSFGGEAVQARFGETYLCVSRPYREIPDTPLCMDGETHTPFGVFSVREALPGETGDGRMTQVIPAYLLEGAVVSSRRAGDAMIPFGQHSSVKIKKLMIDSGVERAMRQSVPIIRNADAVLWMAGLRPSEYCRAHGGEKLRMMTFRRAECMKIQHDDELQEEKTHE